MGPNVYPIICAIEPTAQGCNYQPPARCALTPGFCPNEFPTDGGTPPPTDDQIHAARGEARLAVKEYQQLLNYLDNGLGQAAIGSLIALLLAAKDKPGLQAAGWALSAAFLELIAAATSLQAAFAGQLDAGFDWSEANLTAFSVNVHTLEAAFVLAVAGLSVALTRVSGDVGWGPELEGGFIAGMLIGTDLTIGDLFPKAYGTIDAEWADLGYPPGDFH
jgi:hypothetical protein